MPSYEIDGIRPVVHPEAYIHPTAVLIGDVVVAKGCYVGPCAVLRGDFGPIELEQSANLQDTCVMHGFPSILTLVKEYGHIGHGAVLHGCIIGNNSLVGMNSVIMDESEIGDCSIVGAMTFIKANSHFEANSLIVGSPAKVLRKVTEQEIKWKSKGTTVYQELTHRCQNSLREVEPFTEVEPNREKIKIDYETLASIKNRNPS